MNAVPQEDHISFYARLTELSAMMLWVRGHAALVRFRPIDQRQLELAVEEALVNIIHYAYRQQEGSIELTCYIYPGERLELVIKDRGVPFNPLLQVSKPSPPEIPLEEQVEGGFGILLMRRYLDQVFYERQGAYNLLTLIKQHHKNR